jgi:imidazolonepropionase-like amidohydrolase
MTKAGSIWTPSMFFGKLVSYGGSGAPRPGNKADIAWDNIIKMLPRANKAGIIIVPGDDYGAQGLDHAPGVYATELEIYVRNAGMPASEVLRWATLNGARAALDDDKYGSIQPGKVADLLVVNGDPADDIALLKRPLETLDAIMLGGEFVKNKLEAHASDEPIYFQADLRAVRVAAE